MARDWTREEREYRRERSDDRHLRREPEEREDFGQADFSTDYAYDPERRAGYRTSDEMSRRGDDYGQADYSTDYAYDRDRGAAYRRFSDDDRTYDRGDADLAYGRRMERGDYRHGEPSHRDEHPDIGERRRSWRDRAGAFLTGREEGQPVRRRRGASDRVLWAVIVERLEDERGLDLRDVEVLVDDGDVTLNGTVRRKEDKRRIEDIADVQGVRNVQNNLRVRESGRRWF